MGNDSFLKYFTVNYVLNFLYIIFNENPSMKNFCLWEIYIYIYIYTYVNNKTKSENTMTSHVQ